MHVYDTPDLCMIQARVEHEANLCFGANTMTSAQRLSPDHASLVTRFACLSPVTAASKHASGSPRRNRLHRPSPLARGL